MKKLLMLLLMSYSTAAFAQKSNYSGTWQLDTTKTVFGKAPIWIIPKTIIVEQKVDKIILNRINLDTQFHDQPAVTETLPFDHTSYVYSLPSGAVSTTLNWSDDQSFNISRKGALTVFETWTLEDNEV